MAADRRLLEARPKRGSATVLLGLQPSGRQNTNTSSPEDSAFRARHKVVSLSYV